MKSMFKDTGILFVITLIAGLLLGAVYQITKEPIAYQKELKKIKSYQAVFPEAVSFEALELSQPEKIDDRKEEKEQAGDVTINLTSCALDENQKKLGYVIDITSHEGYNGDIRFSMGIRMDGTINGISLLAISETPGLGMKAEEVLQPQFSDKKVAAFVVTKTQAMTSEEIDAISGATITSQALVNGVHEGLNLFYSQLGGGNNE